MLVSNFDIWISNLIIVNMPKDLMKEDANVGKIIYEWAVKEYEQHERSRRWYLVMGGLAALLILYGVASANYLFALIIVLFVIILYLYELQEPLQVYFAITETGIILGKKYYRYSELKNFWIIYNPPEVQSLYFALDGLVKHRLQIPLLDYDPGPIRGYLGQYLLEDLDQEEEPFSDRMARVLKLH